MTDLTATLVEQLAVRLGANPTEVDLFDLRGRMAHLDEAEREALVNEVISSTYSNAINATFAEVGLNGDAWTLRIKAMATQAEALAMLRRADHVEVVAEAHALQAAAGAKLTAAEQHAQVLAADVDRLTVLEVEALDRLTDATENHTEVEGEHRQYEALAAKASRLTDSLARLHAARSILGDRQREATTATSARASAEAVRNEQRSKVTLLRQAVTEAEKITKTIEDHPDAAPRSETTLLYALNEAVNGYRDLTKPEQATLRRLVASISRQIGADREAVLRGRDQTLKEAQATIDRQRALTPAKGSVTYFPPGVG